MASARPSSFKAGGGFLNNVDGVIVNYEFTTEFPGYSGKASKKKSDFNPLYCVLSAQIDGADDPAVTTLFVGSADDFEIEDDGKTLVPVDKDGGLRQNSDFSYFIDSLVKAGFPETNLPDDAINFEAIIGTRVRFVQERDEETTKRLGKKKSKNGKKEYDRTRLKVANVYALPDAKSGSKAKSKAADADNDDIATLATQSLVALLKKSPGKKLLKKKLPVGIINQIGNKHPNRNEIKDMVVSDEFLSNDDAPWSYDEDTQEVSL